MLTATELRARQAAASDRFRAEHASELAELQRAIGAWENAVAIALADLLKKYTVKAKD